MSKDGNRSRSPKNSQQSAEASDLETQMLAMWTKTIEPLMHEKNEGFESAVKGLVIAVVSAEVKKLETKMESGFFRCPLKIR